MASKDLFFLPDKKQNKKEAKNEEKKPVNADFKFKRQEKFDKNRDNLQEKEKKQENGKKPFDKKTYRLKKYSKKYKLQQFEEQRKKKLLHKYQKTLKNETPGTYKPIAFDEDTTDSSQVGRFVRHPDLTEKELENNQKPKAGPLKNAQDRIKSMKEKSLKDQTEILKAKEEKAKKYAEYKKKKQERFKKLSVKNKKGQPVMALRMELLLDKLRSESK